MNFSERTGDNIAIHPARLLSGRKLDALASDLLPLCDFLCLLLAVTLSSLLYTYWLAPPALAPGLGYNPGQLVWVAAVLAPFILYDKRFGEIASRGQISVLVHSHALRFAFLLGVVLALGAVSQALDDLARAWLVTWFALSLLLITSTRVLAAATLRRLQRRSVLTEAIAVVGAGRVADRLIQALRQTRPQAVELLGVFDDNITDAPSGTTRPTGSLAQLIELGKTRRIDWILLTLPPTEEQRVLSIVQRLQALAVPIGLCPQHVGLTLPYHSLEYIGDSVPVSLLADRPIKRWNAVVKGTEDYLIGGCITLLLLPLLAIIALAIKLDSPGPIVFRQRRHAFNNHEFDVYKFRSMRWAPAATIENLRQTSRNDNRVTRVGRFLRASSLDELPQLFNVLKGDMSLVGPRPHATNMRTEDRLCHEIIDLYAHRHRVKPGITGWSQVNGSRGAVVTETQLRHRVEMDLHYIENWTLLLDLKILALTGPAVIGRTNAY